MVNRMVWDLVSGLLGHDHSTFRGFDWWSLFMLLWRVEFYLTNFPRQWISPPLHRLVLYAVDEVGGADWWGGLVCSGGSGCSSWSLALQIPARVHEWEVATDRSL